jgi:hypothetical protein
VYFDLAVTDLGNTGQVKLDLSSLPPASQLVTVSGQVRGSTTNDGVRSTVKFFNSTFQGLTAAFGPAVTTDSAGRYSAKLFPGNNYRVVVVPEGASDDGSAVAGPGARRQWALTVREQLIISSEASQVVDLTVIPTRILEGVATAGRANVPAQARPRAAPITRARRRPRRSFARPTARASDPVDDTNGHPLVVDPGFYDLSLKPAPSSNLCGGYPTFMSSPSRPDRSPPAAALSDPSEGTVTVSLQGRPSRLQCHRTGLRFTPPPGKALQVGTARTDDTGHYYALPPDSGPLALSSGCVSRLRERSANLPRCRVSPESVKTSP